MTWSTSRASARACCVARVRSSSAAATPAERSRSRSNRTFCIASTHDSSWSRTSSSRACRSEEHTSELQSRSDLVCRLLLEKKNRRVHLRSHRELTGPDEDFDSDCVVLERPAQPKALVRLRESVPAQRADPGAAQRADEPPQIDVSRERGLEDRRVRPGGLQRARTQEAKGAPRDAIPKVRPLHELAVGEAMERAGELLRMDAQASPQSLKGALRIRIMGQELEHLTVVVAQVVESLARRRVHGGRYHGERTHGGGLP